MIAETSRTAAKKTILVVEDDPHMIALHRDFLSDSYTVILKTDGKKTLRFLKEARGIDLAIIDFRLPDMSGIEVLKEVKKALPFIPAIFITAYGSEDIAVKAFRCGAREYIKKPFVYDEFVKRIDFCLSLSEIRQVKRRTPVVNEQEDNIADASASKRSYSLQQAKKYIDNNYTAEIALEQVAEIAGVSVYHFCRLFKVMTGVTFQSYVNRLRMEQARKLLDDDGFSITQIAFSVGYSDLTHFDRIFKKVSGCTPTQYKARATIPGK